MTQLIQGILQAAFNLFAGLLRGIFGAPATAVQGAAQGATVRRGTAAETIAVRHAVLRPGRPVETASLQGDDDPRTRHWVAERLGMVIGVVSVMHAPMPDADDGPTWQLRGMAILPQYRGTGLGAALLAEARLEVDAPMWCNAREAAVGFYQRAGWSAVGEPFDIEPIGPHLRMRTS